MKIKVSISTFIYSGTTIKRPESKQQLQSDTHIQETTNIKSDNQQQQIESLKAITGVIKNVRR